MKKLNIGIIGAGRIGQLHADNALHSDRVALKAIADISIDHVMEAYQEKVPLITRDTSQVFNHPEVDAVFICSSTDTHAELIKKAAHAGKHIFCEKPVSFSIAETQETIESAQEAGVHFQVGFNRRFDKHFRKVYETVRSGKVGTPHVIKVTSRDPEAPPMEYVKHSGGMFMDMTIHDFDMVRHLSGREVIEISVKAANLVDPAFARHNDVDTAIITLLFDDGALGVIDNSRQAVYGYDQRIEVFGDQGMVAAENEHYTNVHVYTQELISIDHPKYFFLDRYQETYIEEMNHFASVILEGIPSLCTGEDGLKAELLAVAAHKSWQENRSVKLSEIESVGI